MNVSLYQAAAALGANSRWQEIVADNLASNAMPGFKRQELSLAAVQAGLMPNGQIGGANQTFVLPQASAVTNFTPGQALRTGVTTDVAIDGKGFFNVSLPNGVVGYTRNGQFQLNAQGQLTTAEGYPVLGPNGPIKLDPANHGSVTISPSGEISQGGTPACKIQLTDFADPSLLTQVSGSYFLAQNPKLHTQPTHATLREGYLEGSNVSSLTEMSSLLTAMRGFEANTKMIQIQDDHMNKTISDLGGTG